MNLNFDSAIWGFSVKMIHWCRPLIVSVTVCLGETAKKEETSPHDEQLRARRITRMSTLPSLWSSFLVQYTYHPSMMHEQ